MSDLALRRQGVSALMGSYSERTDLIDLNWLMDIGSLTGPLSTGSSWLQSIVNSDVTLCPPIDCPTSDAIPVDLN
jgi:hypothetical protein